MKHSRTSLFLMELIISIFLFTVSSAVCIRLFVQAHFKEKAAKELQFALTEVQNAYEEIRGLAYAPDRLLQNSLQYYDENFRTCNADSASYCMTVSTYNNKEMLEAEISFSEFPVADSEPIYSTELKLYIPESAGEISPSTQSSKGGDSDE